MSETAVDRSATKPRPSEPEIDATLDAMAEFLRLAKRSPLMHSPAEQGLEFESVTFPSEDGTPLEAWFIPAPGSDRLVVSNHPLGFSRSGLPSHLEPWRSANAPMGNDFEVDLVPDYRLLHDAGYNVLTYDLRNLGHSGAANGGVVSAGIYESRDVVGSLAYVRSRADTRGMTVGLFSRCLGANATIMATARRPEVFDGVRCLVAPQPLSQRANFAAGLAQAGIPAERMADLDDRVQVVTSFRLDEMSPLEAARSVQVPTLMWQVRDDVMTFPSDVQAIFDSIPVRDKELFWIEGSTRRWDGYTHFAQHPERVLDWFARHMS